jgi:starch phosphorylase
VDSGDDVLTDPGYTDMVHTGSSDGGTEIYSATIPLPSAGSMGYTVRVLPHHPLLAGPAELGLVKLAGSHEQGDAVAPSNTHL